MSSSNKENIASIPTSKLTSTSTPFMTETKLAELKDQVQQELLSNSARRLSAQMSREEQQRQITKWLQDRCIEESIRCANRRIAGQDTQAEQQRRMNEKTEPMSTDQQQARSRYLSSIHEIGIAREALAILSTVPQSPNSPHQRALARIAREIAAVANRWDKASQQGDTVVPSSNLSSDSEPRQMDFRAAENQLVNEDKTKQAPTLQQMKINEQRARLHHTLCLYQVHQELLQQQRRAGSCNPRPLGRAHQWMRIHHQVLQCVALGQLQQQVPLCGQRLALPAGRLSAHGHLCHQLRLRPVHSELRGHCSRTDRLCHAIRLSAALNQLRRQQHSRQQQQARLCHAIRQVAVMRQLLQRVPLAMPWSSALKAGRPQGLSRQWDQIHHQLLQQRMQTELQQTTPLSGSRTRLPAALQGQPGRARLLHQLRLRAVLQQLQQRVQLQGKSTPWPAALQQLLSKVHHELKMHNVLDMLPLSQPKVQHAVANKIQILKTRVQSQLLKRATLHELFTAPHEGNITDAGTHCGNQEIGITPYRLPSLKFRRVLHQMLLEHLHKELNQDPPQLHHLAPRSHSAKAA